MNGAPLQTVNEDAGLRTVTSFVTNLARGPATAIDEVSQVLDFRLSLVTIDGNLAFTTLAINPATGNLTYQAEPDTNGRAVVEVVLMDDGGTVRNGVNTSTPATFTISVAPVNDAPGFTRGPNLSVNEDSDLQQFISWATDIRKGPLTATDEDSQA